MQITFVTRNINMQNMTITRIIFLALLSTTLAGCGKSGPDPIGTWTVRHELKHHDPQSAESTLEGFSTSKITIKDNSRFQEIVTIQLLNDWDPPATEYNGT